MKKIKIGFVILHYMNVKVTSECVDSIRRNVGIDSYKILIIDNCSPNKSGQKLLEKYKTSSDIEIYLNTSNDGFARGNNIGYSLYKEKCKFICFLNNDVELRGKNFFNKVEKLYEEKKFAVLGPRIELLDNVYCELMPEIGDYREEKRKYYKKQIRYLMAILGLNTLREQLAAIKNRGKEAAHSKINIEHLNIILQGCCLIYSEEYINKNEWAFDPRTKFYGEEALLYLHIRKQGLTTLYSPLITVYHKESVSTKESKTTYKKHLFQLSYTCKSQKLLVSDLKSKEREEKIAH